MLYFLLFLIKLKKINCNGKLLSYEKPLIMGVLNITPDSFYADSRAIVKDILLKKTAQFIQQGVDIIDIGAVSTRPNAKKYASENEEIDRISTALDILTKEFPKLTFSCDTFRAKVVDIVVKNYRIAIINDISGGTFDHDLLKTVIKWQVPYVLSHTKGDLTSMHLKTNYTNFIAELLYFFSEKIAELRSMGLNDIIIDPGFGFAKTIDQNFELLKKIAYLRTFDCPIMVGLSRKSMFYKTFNTTPEESLNGTSVANFFALQGGAKIIRVHDVKEAKETSAIFNKLHI